MNGNEEGMENVVATALRASRQPVVQSIEGHPYAFVPDGYTLSDLSKVLDAPTRMTGVVTLDDTDSFIEQVQSYSIDGTRIYCATELDKGLVSFVAVFNDHDGQNAIPGWRDHRAHYAVRQSEEWKRWIGANGKRMPQADFAAFLEENLKDIAAVEGMPTGTQMLELALTFEATQDSRFKQSVRLQSGGVDLTYVDQEDEATLKKMKLFDRFTLGIAPFFNGDAYQLGARLRYRIVEGKLSLWYELLRPDLVVQAATRDLIAKIKAAVSPPVVYGKP